MGKNKAFVGDWLRSFPIHQGVFHIGPVDKTFEDIYISTRSKEGRLYEDDLVTQLPDVPAGHPFEKEWAIRKYSTLRLLEYISYLDDPLILDVGCGNGWLSNQLSTLATVIGMDINLHELHQAARLFKDPFFCYGNIMAASWSPPFEYDVVLFASSIQYFPDLNLLFDKVFGIMSPEGEIHIIDSPVYPDAEATREAAERSADYYRESSPDMIPFYFHHHFAELENYQVTVLNQSEQRSFFDVIFGRKPDSRFPWIVLKK